MSLAAASAHPHLQPALKAAGAPTLAKQPDWMPRMWHGCDLATWLALLVRNRFAVHPRYWYIAACITIGTTLNSLLGLLERAVYGRKVRATAIAQPPIFIIGHWRTGTTLLHELMICDERFSFPTTYQCIEAHHFLLSEGWLSRWLQRLMPATRPMDNMPAAMDRPQEDEFALCMLGAGSFYARIAFPNRAPHGEDFLDLESVSPASRERWKARFYRFLQRLTLKTGKRLVLKSPPHTARIKALKEMFPDALFIHIVRNPFEVFPSTVNLWRTLYKGQGLQTPTCDGIEEMVLDTYVRMHEKLEAGRKTLREEQFYELPYERLVKDPIGEIDKIYDYFRLPGFEECLPRLQAYMASTKTYETNKYKLSAEQRAAIADRWGAIIARYGYA